MGTVNLPSPFAVAWHGLSHKWAVASSNGSNLFDASFIFVYIYDIYMIVHAICDHPRVLFVTSLQTLFNWFELFVNRIVGLRLNFNTNRSKLSTCIKHYQSIYFFGGRTPLGRFWIVPPQEFVHGDLGRTKPSMRSFLQGQVRRPRSAWRTKIRLDSWSP